MDKNRLSLGEREVRRLQVLTLVLEGRVSLKVAAEKLGLSYRQAKRLKRRLKKKGPEGLVHGNRGREPANRIPGERRGEIVALAREKYALFNDSHLQEMLWEEERIEVGRETLRRILRASGLAPKKARKPRRHHRRRPRKRQEGLMMLWDGSPHHWFGESESPCCLMAAMDDAGSRVLAARFLPQECSAGYLWLLDRVVRRYGIPRSVYQDRHGALQRNDEYWSLEEQMRGRRDPTQVGAALQALGIEPIRALTPQAKGRVERLFGILQDRLVAELVLHGIRDVVSANRFLERTYLPRHNRRFAVPAEEAQSAFAPVPPGLDLSRLISFRYQATVGNDNAIRLGGLIIDVPPGPTRRTYAKARVEVRQLLDGSWRVYYHDQLIARHRRTPFREPRRVRRPGKTPLKGAQEWLSIYLASKA
jgi:transposase